MTASPAPWCRPTLPSTVTSSSRFRQVRDRIPTPPGFSKSAMPRPPASRAPSPAPSMPLPMRLSFAAAVIASFAAPVWADDVTDTIQSALEAYNEGDIAYATEELNFALQLLKEMRAADLRSFLPEPLDGWTREIDADAAAAVGMMGGMGAVAAYVSDDDNFTITIVMDSPMVTGMAPLLSNPAIAASSGARMVRVGREKFVSLDGDLNGLIGNRILVQADGDDTDAIVAHLETMDFRALSQFGL